MVHHSKEGWRFWRPGMNFTCDLSLKGNLSGTLFHNLTSHCNNGKWEGRAIIWWSCKGISRERKECLSIIHQCLMCHMTCYDVHQLESHVYMLCAVIKRPNNLHSHTWHQIASKHMLRLVHSIFSPRLDFSVPGLSFFLLRATDSLQPLHMCLHCPLGLLQHSVRYQ